MSTTNHVKLGPLAVDVFGTSVLRDRDDFPASQVWANEIETLLLFLKAENQLERFVPRLRARERDAALAEVRAAYFFHLVGFLVCEWEPEAVPGIPGDLEVTLPHGIPLFVEVKCPGWQSEVQDGDRAARKWQPKYISGECGSVDPIEHVMYSVSKAIPKLDPTRTNLVVTVDDLFMSPLDWPLDDQLAGRLSSNPDCSAVSAVLILNPVAYVGQPLEYRSMLVQGSGANLSPAIIAALDRRGEPVLPLGPECGT